MMKKVALILSVLVLFSGSLFANPLKSFKVCTHLGPDVWSVDDEQKLLPYEKIGIDINTYSLRLPFNQWCNNQYDPYSSFNPQYGINVVDSGGYGGWWWYSVGSGLIGRYVDWWACADSLALWDKLAGMYADSMAKYHANDEGFAMYRIMDGDSGYFSGISTRFAADGFERLHDSLASHDPCLNYPSSNPGRHYTYFWGSLNYPPYYLSTILSWMPNLDVGGPGSYGFQAGVATQDALDGLVNGCETYASTMKSKNKALMILLQCGWQYSDAPTFSELRAASWVALAHGNAWLGYYSYRVGQAIYPEDSIDGAVGVIEGNKPNSQQRPYVEDPSEFRQEFGLSEEDWPDSYFNTNANYWMNLYDVIDEVKQIGDTLAQISWGYAISVHQDPPPYEYENVYVWNVTGAQYVDLGFFNAWSPTKYLMVVNREQENKTITVYIKYLGKNKLRVINMANGATTTCSLDQSTNCYIFTRNYEAGQGKLFKLVPYGDKPKLGLTGEWREAKGASGYMQMFSDPGGGGGSDWGYAFLTWEWKNYIPPTLTYMQLWERWDFSKLNWHRAVGQLPGAKKNDIWRVMLDSIVQFIEVGEHPDGDEITWPPGVEGPGTKSNQKTIYYQNKDGCPALYSFYYEDTSVSPGHVFMENNTILPHSEHFQQVIGEDLLKLDVLNDEPDHYYMAVAENDDEISYLDQVKLWVVDHPENTEVATSADDSTYVYSDRIAPTSCVDNQSNDRLEEVSWEDTLSYRGATGSYLTVKFDDPGWSNAGLLMSLGDHSEAALPPKNYCSVPKKPGGGGGWDSLGVGYGRLTHSQWMVDVSSADSLTFRVYCEGSDTCFIDRIALVKLESTGWSLTEAVLDSAVKYKADGQSSDATGYLFNTDTFNVTLLEGQQISLRFDKIDTSTTYPVRDFVFQSRGYYIPINPPGSPQSGVEEEPLEFGIVIEQIEPLSRNALINYSVPYMIHVKIGIYDVSGRLVKTVVNGKVNPGRYSEQWPGIDNAGRRVASGIYFVKMETEDYKQTHKIVVLK